MVGAKLKFGPLTGEISQSWCVCQKCWLLLCHRHDDGTRTMNHNINGDLRHLFCHCGTAFEDAVPIPEVLSNPACLCDWIETHGRAPHLFKETV
jgi:hypothetical protein